VRVKFAVLAIIVAVGFAGAAQAAPINPFNTRPVTIGASGEPTLQSVINSVGGWAGVSAVTDQQSAGMWSMQNIFAGVGTSIPTLLVEYAGQANSNVFGIWFGTDTSNILTYDIFTGAASGVTAAGVMINGSTLDIFGNPAAVVVQTVTNPLISPYLFGFYLRNGNNYFFTADDANGGAAYAVAYRAPGTNDWLLGFEDMVGGDGDFQDMVVKVESIGAVPEPGSMILLGSGLAALWARRRRHS
jgi:hypothetical protein